MPDVSVRYHLPAPELRPFVSSYFFASFAGDGGIDDLFHPQWANLQFILSGRWSTRLGDQALDPTPEALLVGPTSRPLHVRGTAPSATVGIGLLPLGWSRLVAQPARGYADRMAPAAELDWLDPAALIDELRGCATDEASVARLDALLLARLAMRPGGGDDVARLHRSLLDPAIATAEALAAAIGVTLRKLERICHRAFGFPPKLLLRRQRFLRTLDRLQSNPAVSTSRLIDPSYVDQSHFNRDFRRFVETSPSDYLARPRPLLGPAARARAALLGASLHGLHAARTD